MTVKETVQRHTWCDLLIEAESLGLLPAGAVNLGLRLAKAIEWSPTGKRKGQPSGLYWKNEEALVSVCSSRATYFRYRESLFETGFFEEVNGNLIPRLPDLSQIETTQSQIETTQSQIDNPYSVDTYSVDTYSEDNSMEVADAPSVFSNESLGEARVDIEPSLNLSVPVLPFNDAVEGFRQSQSETRTGLTPEQKARACAYHNEQRAKQLTPRIEEEW